MKTKAIAGLMAILLLAVMGLNLTPVSADSVYGTTLSEGITPKGLGDVVFSFLGPDSGAAGLTWDGANLWLADIWSHTIYKIDPSDGSVISSFSAPADYPTGLAWDGAYLWVACEQAATAYKLDPSDGSVVSSIHLPGYGEFDPNSACITWDGEYLWHTDYTSYTIYKLDPSDGTVVYSFASPGSDPVGLTWDGDYLWHSDCGTDTIYKLDPSDGSVVLSFASPASKPWDLAWDGAYLWNADTGANTVYKIYVGVFQYHFRLSPGVNVVHLNVTPEGWLHGYMTGGPTGWNPVLGKYEAGRFYMAIDILPDQEPGYYEMLFLVGTVATRTGQLIQTYDGMKYFGPHDVDLVPAGAESEELQGPDITEVSGSQMTPAAWYVFQISPYSEIVHLNTNPGRWLNGYDETPEPDAPVLGFYEGGRFYFGMDGIHGAPITLIFIAGEVPTRDGNMIRTEDGTTFDGPIPIWLTPA